jgi:hypothetical protein
LDIREPGRTAAPVEPATTDVRLRAASDVADGGVRTEVDDVLGPVVLVDAEGR